MRIERELMRGAGPVAVLKLLERREMYGYELVETLAAKSNGVLDMGQSTLYPMLYNLEAQGYVRATWRNADTGRQRKYYALTGKGKKRVEAETKQWQAVAGAMRALGILPTAKAAACNRSAGMSGERPVMNANDEPTFVAFAKQSERDSAVRAKCDRRSPEGGN